MIIKTVTETKKEMSALLDQIEDDRMPVLITRGSRPPAVMLSYDEYRSWTEMAHLRASPANARRLDEAMADYRDGKARERALVEPEE